MPALACDMSFASREKAVFSQWEVGVGLVAGGGPMARLPRVMGRGRALEVLLSSDDIGGADAEFFGYVNRALPDAELESFVGPPLNAPGAGSRRPGLSSPAAVLP
jgi:enoyl-CoA hydratase/carnithine racemase